MKRGDLIIIFTAILLGLLLLLLPSEPGESLTVISEGGTVGTYSLSQDREFTVGGNTIVISDGAVHMKAADCPGGDCLSAGEISRAGESIVCLPNRLILRIDGTSGDGPDAMTGGVGG
ncbi:MAG: NusG domain II-containing protein [Clostridia bacterium]|nr:NusG domain II-containing protein [Clostridia bacterium]